MGEEVIFIFQMVKLITVANDHDHDGRTRLNVFISHRNQAINIEYLVLGVILFWLWKT